MKRKIELVIAAIVGGAVIGAISYVLSLQGENERLKGKLAELHNGQSVLLQELEQCEASKTEPPAQ